MPAPVWKNNANPTKLKVRIFKSNVLSVLLYGCSTWKVSRSLTNKLQVYINRSLRSIYRIYWPKTISNDELCKMAGIQSVDNIIKRQKWGSIGHRMNNVLHIKR